MEMLRKSIRVTTLIDLRPYFNNLVYFFRVDFVDLEIRVAALIDFLHCVAR